MQLRHPLKRLLRPFCVFVAPLLRASLIALRPKVVAQHSNKMLLSYN